MRMDEGCSIRMEGRPSFDRGGAGGAEGRRGPVLVAGSLPVLQSWDRGERLSVANSPTDGAAAGFTK